MKNNIPTYNNNTVTATYNKPKGKFIVNSHFTGEASISDLIYKVLVKTENYQPQFAK